MPMPDPEDFFKSLVGDHAEKLKKEYEGALAHEHHECSSNISIPEALRPGVSTNFVGCGGGL
jgi:hypothetical protein